MKGYMENKKSLVKKILSGLVIVVTLGICILEYKNSQYVPTLSNNNENSITGLNKDVKKRDNSLAVKTSLGAGTFIVGKDIPVGRYICTAEGNGNFFIYENSIAIINEILGEGDFGTSSITTDFEYGQKIEISGIKKVNFTPAETKLETELTTGTWTVGLDINSGKYICETTNGSGNFFVYRDGFTIVNEILASGESSFGVPNITIELKDGDEIQISGIEKVVFKDK